MPAQVRLLHRILGVGHRPKHAVCETEQAPAVRLKARGRIRHRASGSHVRRLGPDAMRRERARARPPRAVAISPNTSATAPPTTPLPVPGPPSAMAKTSPPLTREMNPATRATKVTSRPEAAPKRLAERATASPPRATPTSATTTAVLAQSRWGVRPYTVVAAGSETCVATSTAYTSPPNRAAATGMTRTRAKVRLI